MAEHVLDWLGAYLDGELAGQRLKLVEDHLAACPECQAELSALSHLSEMAFALEHGISRDMPCREGESRIASPFSPFPMIRRRLTYDWKRKMLPGIVPNLLSSLSSFRNSSSPIRLRSAMNS